MFLGTRHGPFLIFPLPYENLVSNSIAATPFAVVMYLIYADLDFLFIPQYAMFLTLIFLVELVAAIVGFVFRHEVSLPLGT